MMICLMTSVICVTAIPASAAGDFSVTMCGRSYDGLEWGIGIYGNLEEAWNDAIYYATHLDEAWNGAVRYETEEERPAVEGFTCIILDFYDDWNSDSNGSFGSGIGFKDGAIYVPSDAKIDVNLGGHTIFCNPANNEANGKAMYIDAGADVKIRNGTIVGGVYADNNAKTDIKNVYISDDAVKNGDSSARFASIFGEGSVTNILIIISLIASCISIFLTVYYNKKKAAPAAEKDAGESDDEQ